jgi:hypothetical protein
MPAVLGGQQREVTHFNPLNGLHIHTAHTYQYNNTALDVTVCTYRQFCTGVQERNTVRLCDVLCCDGTPRKQPPEAATVLQSRATAMLVRRSQRPRRKFPSPRKPKRRPPGAGDGPTPSAHGCPPTTLRRSRGVDPAFKLR